MTGSSGFGVDTGRPKVAREQSQPRTRHLRPAHRRFLIGGLAAATVLGSLPAAPAGPGSSGRRVRALSGVSPFPKDCESERNFRHGEVEPSIAADPSNPRHLVAAWQQDRRDFAARGIMVAISHDGGRSWKRRVVRNLSVCSGNDGFNGVSDPWVSFGPDGHVYLAVLQVEGQLDDRALPVVVSPNRGRSWRDPVLVAGPAGECPNCNSVPGWTLIDKETITAHPTKSGAAYVVWSRNDADNYRGAISTTADGGKSWSSPRYFQIGTNASYSHEIAVTREGTLVDVYIEPGSTTGYIYATSSTDDGETWTSPTLLGSTSFPQARGAIHPDTERALRTAYFPAITVRGDDVYVAWCTILDRDHSQVLLTRTRDGGATWSAPSVIAKSDSQAFNCALDAARDGTLGLIYYDFSDDQAGDGELSTTIWFMHSHDGGKTWHRRRALGPFDAMSAPAPGGIPMIGDYQGLVGLKRHFAAAVQVMQPVARKGPSDIFFMRLRTRRSSESQSRGQ